MSAAPPIPLDAVSAPRATRLRTGLGLLLQVVEHAAGLVLATDVAVVFASVVYRYLLHDPLEWTEEVASALLVMLIFLGAATLVGRRGHVGIDVFTRMLSPRWRAAVAEIATWITAALALVLLCASVALHLDTQGQTTATGMPLWMFHYPVILGCGLMLLFAFANAASADLRLALGTLLGFAAVAGGLVAWVAWTPEHPALPIALLLVGFAATLAMGVPIAFVLASAAMLYFLAEPSLPLLILSQQLIAGGSHFVLLAIPFFVLAGLTMEANGMSSRLVELLLRMIGRVRGGLGLIVIIATALFSGVSGSKLADVAAVGGIVMPAARRTRQDPNDAAGLLACSAVMAETIPPCVNMIIFGFVANISIGGLFVAGLVPAAVLAVALSAVAVACGVRVDPAQAFEVRRPLGRLVAGAGVAFLMVALIGKGVTSGVATSTEVSAFAVVYAFVVGGLAFRELTWRSVVRLFVQSAAMTGGILFIVAAATSLSYALTIEQIPAKLFGWLVALGRDYGQTSFMLVATAMMVFFGMVLEGAPALILFGPLLTPIAVQLGVHPLQFGTIMVIAMGLGYFAPPLGLGLFATCAITGTQVREVVPRMAKYLAVLALGLLALVLLPGFALWLPGVFGMR